MIGLIGGGVTAALAAIVVLVVVLTQPDSHSLSTPASAAGFTRDNAAEQRINTEELKRNLRNQANGKVKRVVSAVYSNAPGGTANTEVLFVGGEASSMDTQSFIDDFTSTAQNTQSVGNTGGLTGKGACGELTDSAGRDAVACVWADNDTFGQFLMLTDGHAVGDLADLMRRMRPVLEKTN
ncbi:MAG TPA: hypothetical protein VGL93_01485 [Streptosporangiaceae bacterium]|jgi:hypothetical protein